MTKDKNDKPKIIKMPVEFTKESVTVRDDSSTSSTNLIDVIDFEESMISILEGQIEELKNENKNLTKKLSDSRKKLGVVVSLNEMLKIQLQDLITQLDFLTQHLNITKQNARNMHLKLPKIGNLDITLDDNNED